MQLTRPPRCDPPLHSSLQRAGPGGGLQPRPARCPHLACKASGGSVAQHSSGRRPGSLELRRASGGWASTSASRSRAGGRRTTGRGRCAAAEEDEDTELSYSSEALEAEEDEDIELTYSDEVLAPGDVDPEADESDDEEEEEEAIDWWAFWRDVDEGDGLAEQLEDEREEEMNAQEKIEWMVDALPALRARDDFVSVIPVPTVKQYALDLPEAEVSPQNPPWNAWDYRAFVEKEGRKARDDAAWKKRMAAVGQYQHLNVTRFNDLRLIERENMPREWTDEETWQFINMDGHAADPREVVIKVEDPRGRCDILELGGKYIESTEDHLRRTGHWLETAPPEEELDTGVAQLAADFADFEEPGADGGGVQLIGMEEAGRTMASTEDGEGAYQEDDF